MFVWTIHHDILAECAALGRGRVGRLCEVDAGKAATHEAAIWQAKDAVRLRTPVGVSVAVLRSRCTLGDRGM